MKTLQLLAGTVVLCLAPSAFAQMPVTVTSDVPAAIHQIQTMAQWGKQYQQMVSQITQMKSQFDATTGNRGLGQILNAPALRAYLPDQWAGVYDRVRSGELSGISSRASSIYAVEKFDPQATGGQKRQQEVLASNKAMTMQAYDASLARVNNINALMLEADRTQDVKGAADLQNRMAAENAMIQNEQIRLGLLAQLQQVEMQLAKEQKSREFREKYLK